MNNEKDGRFVSEVDKEKNNVNKISSRLRSIIIIFFRHQHILNLLIMIMIFIRLILEFSTSKVDIL